MSDTLIPSTSPAGEADTPGGGGPPSVLSARACRHCGTDLDPGWQFCGGCGRSAEHDTPAVGTASAPSGWGVTDAQESRAPNGHRDTDLPATRPSTSLWPTDQTASQTSRSDQQPRRTRRWLRWLLIGTAVAILVGLITGLVLHDLGVQDRLERTRATLAATRQTLAQTEAKLAETTQALTVATTDLETRTRERDDLQVQLTSTKNELEGVRGSLSNAENRINLQAGQIESLKTCLNGVSDALGYAAYGDYYSAVAALDAVQYSCEAASEVF